MGLSELLREFERKYTQLPLAERCFLDTREVELFLQATDSALQDRFLLLLGVETMKVVSQMIGRGWRRQ